MLVTHDAQNFTDGNGRIISVTGFYFLGRYQLTCCVGTCWQTMGYRYFYRQGFPKK